MVSLVKLIKKTSKMIHPRERSVVISNVTSLSVLQAITYLLPVVILPYLFRVLGPDKFGLIAFAQAFIQYFIILTDYGFSITATKEISLCLNEHKKVCDAFSSILTAKIALAFVSLLVLCAAVYFIPRFRDDWMVYIFSFGAVVGSTIFPLWFFQGTEKMQYIASLNIAGGVILTLLIFIFVRGPQDYLVVPIAYSISSLVTGLLGLRLAFRKFGVSFQLQGYRSLRQQLRVGWDIFISIAAINAYTSTRVFILGLLTNNAITGFYSMAERIANACQTFPLYSFTQALFPRLTKIYQKNKTKAFQFMQRMQQITTYIASLCLPLIFIFANPIIRIACGGDFDEAIISLRLLLVGVYLVSINAFRVQFLLVCGKTHIYSRIHVIMAIVGLPLLFLLIDSFSYKGAAIASIAIEAGIFIITYFTVRKLSFS
ncbi:MAG: flippase [Candidatus Omnitrophica bacterium]|nr:flippase [Candidatus Omnitrophota bacterium]